MQMCMFVRYPTQFIECSRVRLSWHKVLYQSKNLGLSLFCWWDIHSFLVHFHFSRREKELCSGLFLFCLHKMCFQDESNVQHGSLPISVGLGLLARLLLSFVLVETHIVICSRQAGPLSLSGHAEEASLVG
ncbi:hypothetical protein ATANTOWER_028986 [Ataeniobius toweri]|uniref:Uncharacterized protein n=1 Tax=Ataeniobius toweri TaxID=208326 RepID=A0ABU7BS07_9TELE|nr:hypothetical protein [Ataeniobius toweri]